MTIDEIEEKLATIMASFERAQNDQRGVLYSEMLAAMQCQMLLHICHRLDHVYDMVISVERLVNP